MTDLKVQAKQRLRQQMRRRRRALSHSQQHQAAQGLRRQLHRSGLLLQARRLALYLAQDGELNPLPAVNAVQKSGRLYLPKLHPLKPNRLHFYHWHSKTPLDRNRFGIGEPPARARTRSPWWSLSLILLPLVAFDAQGQRLGMGGGFYDRSLARFNGKRPRLIGIAHACQQVEALPVASWDIGLDGILTDHQFIDLT